MAMILIVDDFPDIRRATSLLLAQSGYEVLEAEDGGRAVEMAAERQPDLILMDLNLPVLSGWEATRRIKDDARTSHIPIVALTAHAMKGDREKAWEAGCDGFITKPVDGELLEDTIKEMLGAGADESARPIENNGARRRALTLHNEHVVVLVEKDEARDRVSGLLKDRGYRVSAVSNVDEAILRITESAAGLVICESCAGNDEGLMTVTRLKRAASPSFLPVILLADGLEDWERAFEAGADDLLVKPVDEGSLLLRARSLLRLRQALQAESMRANEMTSVISQMATGLMLSDAGGTITMVNGRGMELLDLTYDGVIGMNVEALARALGINSDEGEMPLQRALENGETVTRERLRVRTPRGRNVELRVSAAPVYDEHGRRTGASSVFEETNLAEDLNDAA